MPASDVLYRLALKLSAVRRLQADHDSLHHAAAQLRMDRAALLAKLDQMSARTLESIDGIARAIFYHVTPEDVVLDVGANCGIYTRLLSRAAGQVHSFEPQPDIFELLQRDSAAENVTFVNKAVSDRAGTVEFHLDRRPNMLGVASSINVLTDLREQNMIETIAVETVTIDGYCEAAGLCPRFIKIDVEGHECAVFRGARGTIARCRPVVLFEFWETWWENGFSELFDELKPRYHLVRVSDGADALRHYRAQRGTGSADILAVPRRGAGA